MSIFIRVRKTATFLFILFFISACSIIGVHFKLHNPKRAGKYPEPTKKLTLLGDQDSKYRSGFDVTFYDISVSFGQELNDDAFITGCVIMRCTAVKECDTIQLDVADGMEVSFLRLTDLKNLRNASGYKEVYTYLGTNSVRRGNALLIALPRKYLAGEKFNIGLNYKTKPPNAKRPPWKGGFVRKKDDLGNPWWGVACQSEGASMWWPCKDVVNDEPDSCLIALCVPDSLVAVSNGQFIRCPQVGGGIDGRDNGNLNWEWRVTYPINLYNITFYIGKYKLLHDDYISKVTGDTLPLNHYVLVQHYDQAKEHFKQLKNHLAVYEELFGPYPFYNDGFKLVESPYAGMEHQTAIAYGNKFKNNYLGFDYIILHETAHEWWGNSLTAYDLAEGWLHEGFATYAECLYVERTKGYQAYKDYLRTYKWTIINRRPLVGVYGLRYFNYKDGDIYTKGAWVLHTLRETIHNDSVFFDIIKTFATRYAYKNVTSKEFISVVNEKTGSDYQWFFDQYLYNRFVPELEYYQAGDEFYYRWNTDFCEKDFDLPIVLKTAPSQYDTIVPAWNLQVLKCTKDVPVEVSSNVLVRFTETKKITRQHKVKF